MSIPETSCTAHFALTAQPSNCRKQSAHAILTKPTKNFEQNLKKFHFIPTKITRINGSKNLENFKSEKNDSKETSRLWRFLSRKKYQSFRKYLKSHQKTTPTIVSDVAFVSDVDACKFHVKKNSSIITTNNNSANYTSTYNSKSELSRNKLELKRILPIVKTNLALTLDVKPSQRFTQMSKLNPEQISGYSVQQEKSIISDNDANERVSFHALILISFLFLRFKNYQHYSNN